MKDDIYWIIKPLEGSSDMLYVIQYCDNRKRITLYMKLQHDNMVKKFNTEL